MSDDVNVSLEVKLMFFHWDLFFFSNEVQVLREKVLQTKLTEARTSPLGIVFLRDKSGLTSAAVTSNGGLIREPPKCPNSAGITVVCPNERQIWKVTFYVVVESEWCQTWCDGGGCKHLCCYCDDFFGDDELGDLSDGFQKSCLWTGSFEKRPLTENEVWPKWWQTGQLLLERRVQLLHKMLQRQETTPSWRLKENTKSRPMDFRTTPGIVGIPNDSR